MDTSIAPVLFIVFNRPDTTQKVFNRIREAKPQKLYIAADGARIGNANDEVNCKKVREIVGNIDWECEVHKDFSDINLGCCKRPSSAIDWIFEHEDRAIILEDDCYPSLSFFGYCSGLLERYSADYRIMHISGTRYIKDLQLNDDSYFFSRYQRPWGWATWRRAWQQFDIAMKDFPKYKEKKYFEYLFDDYESDYWKSLFDRTAASKSIWDYQWQFSIFFNNGLCIVPQKNLVSNLGDNVGTHLEGPVEYFNQEIDENFIISKHPDVIIRNIKYDHIRFHRLHGKKKLYKRIQNKVLRVLNLKK